MPRKFITADYEATLNQQIRIGEGLPPNHLARFIVDIIRRLDLSPLYACYGTRGGQPYDPPVLLALLFYAYATGVFSSRKIERATYENLPFRYIAGNYHPDHDTLAYFRQSLLPQIADLFVQILWVAEGAGLLNLAHLSLDGTKIHADASKSKAMSHKGLKEAELRLHQEIKELLERAEQVDQHPLPAGLVIEAEIEERKTRLARLAEGLAVLKERGEERYQAQQSQYEEKQAERVAQEEAMGRKMGGTAPTPPKSGCQDKDQYNFTDPGSGIMKNSQNAGFEQSYNAQLAVTQKEMLIVGYSVSNHPNDQKEIAPTLASVPKGIGKVEAVALDNGYFSRANIALCLELGITGYIATGREGHRKGWQEYFGEGDAAKEPGAKASAREKMAYQLQTEEGKAIYRLRKCTVEPVFGIIKEVLGFRQFSLRGLAGVLGEWGLVCMAYNLKRLHSLSQG